MSYDQLAEVLLSAGYTWSKRTETGKLCVDEAVLLALAGYTVYDDEKFGEGLKQAAEHAGLGVLGGFTPLEGSYEALGLAGRFVYHVLNMRETRKLRSTYVDRLLRDRDSAERIHARFNGMVTNTDRLSSSDPNLQNIPIRGTLRDAIRRVFRAKSGHALVKADFGQLEVRIYAHYTQEPALLEAFRTGGDPHQAVADELGIPRWRAKNVLFAAIYGADAAKLAQTAGVEGERAREFLSRLRARLPGMANWHPAIAASLDSRGYVETLFGWRGYYPLWRSPLSKDRNAALREAGNLPIQGSASGIVKRLMIRAEALRRQYDSELVLQVHDEVVYEVPECYAREFGLELQALGEGVAPELTVPLEFEPAIGPNWADLTKIK